MYICMYEQYSFVKLRLDRVIKGRLEGEVADVLKSNTAELEFEEPDRWTAPYSKYASGWWKVFLYGKED